MSRYWNGHQWKDLPTESAHSSVVANAEPAVAEAAELVTPVTVVEQAVAAPLRATLVPTHAEYGDVFVAAAAEATG